MRNTDERTLALLDIILDLIPNKKLNVIKISLVFVFIKLK
jgi:hypothetical protein